MNGCITVLEVRPVTTGYVDACHLVWRVVR